MLDSIRKGSDNIIYTGLILLVVAVMAFVGVGKMGQEEKGGGAAAWVNGELITQREFQQELEFRMNQYRQMLGGQFDEKFLETFQIPQRTLEEMVQYKLLAQQAKSLDFRVSDEELADYIRSIPYYQKDGQFDAEMYSKLPNRGVEERRQRERLLLSRMQEYLVDRVRITPEELKNAYELKETKVDLEYAKIDLDGLAAQQKPSGAAVDEYLKKTPEAQLKAYYESHRKEFSTPATYNINQIRVGIPFKANEAAKADAKKKIEAIQKELNEKNFGEIAKKRSDDEYAKKGGNVGFVSRGTMEPPLEKAIEALQPGKISAPVETSFGYYIVQLVEKKPEAPQAFEAVKKRIGETLLGEQTRKEFVDGKKAQLEKMLADGKPVDGELKALKAEVKKTGPFSLGQGYIPNVGQVDSIVDMVFGLTKEAPVAKKLAYYQDHYYYVKLKSVETPKAGDFAKNRESIEKSSQTALQSTLVSQWIEGLKKNATVKNSPLFDEKAPVAAQ